MPEIIGWERDEYCVGSTTDENGVIWAVWEMGPIRPIYAGATDSDNEDTKCPQ